MQRMKRDNMELKEEFHKNRDELIQCQHVLLAEQERSNVNAATIEEQQQVGLLCLATSHLLNTVYRLCCDVRTGTESGIQTC